MRHGRAKAARKTLQFFERTRGIRPPYDVLLDGTFVVAIVKYKNFPIRERLERLLQHAPFHLVTTRSSLEELERLVEKAPADKKELLQEAMAWARQHCDFILPAAAVPHDNSPTDETKNEDPALRRLSTAGQDIVQWTMQKSATTNTQLPTGSATAKKTAREECSHLVGSNKQYFCASQDEELLDIIRSGGCVPVIRLARGSVLLLEHPSKAATAQARQKEREKWKGTSATMAAPERRLVEIVQKQERLERAVQKTTTPQEYPGAQARRKRKAKGPNPLSCKKKADQGDNASNRRKRTRRKKSSTGDDNTGADNSN